MMYDQYVPADKKQRYLDEFMAFFKVEAPPQGV